MMALTFMQCQKFWLVYATLLVLLLQKYVAAKPHALLVIHRHGARPPLTKHPTDPSEEQPKLSEDTLYPEGIEQLRNLGTYVGETFSQQLTVEQVTAFSSNLTRTMISSKAFLSGLLSDQALVPTYVFDDSESDWIIRGYAICPQLEDNFLQFTKTDEYESKEKEYGDFVRDLADKLQTNAFNSTFDNVFNVYDRYIIIRDGYDTSPDNKTVSPLSDDDMGKLTEVADWFESSKFFHGTRDTPAAGGLLSDMLTRLSEAVDDENGDFRIIEYSAHYPTLLTLLAEMQDPSSEKMEAPADKIPGFGAALFVELDQEDSNPGNFNVRLKWFQGGDVSVSENTKSIAHRRGSCKSKSPENGCPWEEFKALYEPTDLKEFCKACKSNDGACVKANGLSRAVFIIIGIAIGIVVGISLACIVARVRSRKTVHSFSMNNVDDGYVAD